MRTLATAIIVSTLLVGACFDPDYPVGLACDPTGWCPPGQRCNFSNTCVVDSDAGQPNGDGGGGIDATEGLGNLVGIDIGPDVTIAVNGTHQFTVIGIYQNGMEPISDFAIWESTDNNVMFIDFMGLAKGQAAGTATARARYDGRVDTALVTVTP
jgi:hypothetical protein